MSIDAKVAFDKIEHPFKMKSLNTLQVKGKFFNLIEVTQKNPIGNVMFNGEKLNVFLLRLRKK